MPENEAPRIYIVTGMSGAGKSLALNKLEDMGFYCVDNLPASLAPQLVETLAGLSTPRIALGLDVRAGLDFEKLRQLARTLRTSGDVRVIFLDASDDVLLRRYSQTRRSHPLAREGRAADGIALEREKLYGAKEFADVLIDTSQLRPAQLAARLEGLELPGGGPAVLISSFGYKRGLPQDADIVLDCRFLPNPYWVEALRPHTGLDADVRDYIFSHSCAKEFVDRITGLIIFLLPRFRAEDKPRINAAFGCTGGQHRSVCMAEAVASRLREMDIPCLIQHRDVGDKKPNA